MKSIGSMTQGELAAYIDSNLRKNGVNVVLSGGACVAIYSNHQYVSKDLDFIAQFSLDPKKIASVMKSLGFMPKGRYFYHPQTSYFVEFISGPPSVGRDPIQEIQVLKLETGTIRIISPTDCVKDRLAAFYHWGDRQALAQAVLVSKSVIIDLSSIEDWSIREGKQAGFEEYKRMMQED